MLGLALVFLVAALISAVLGLGGTAVISAGTAGALFLVFLGLSALAAAAFTLRRRYP